jgi:hypothetical protein
MLRGVGKGKPGALCQPFYSLLALTEVFQELEAMRMAERSRQGSEVAEEFVFGFVA